MKSIGQSGFATPGQSKVLRPVRKVLLVAALTFLAFPVNAGSEDAGLPPRSSVEQNSHRTYSQVLSAFNTSSGSSNAEVLGNLGGVEGGDGWGARARRALGARSLAGAREKCSWKGALRPGPGSVSRMDTGELWYTPEACELERHTKEAAWGCLKGKHLLLIGDSLTRNLFMRFVEFFQHVPGLYDEKGMFRQRLDYAAMPHLKVQNVKGGGKGKGLKAVTYSMPGGGGKPSVTFIRVNSLSQLPARQVVAVAQGLRPTHVMLNIGVWGLGIAFEGFDHYYLRYSELLALLKKSLHSAEVVVQGLHYINTARCTHPVCTICNHKTMQRTFRAMQQQAAECVGAQLLHQHDWGAALARSEWSADSADGVHFNGPSALIQVEQIFNYLCMTGQEGGSDGAYDQRRGPDTDPDAFQDPECTGRQKIDLIMPAKLGKLPKEASSIDSRDSSKCFSVYLSDSADDGGVDHFEGVTLPKIHRPAAAPAPAAKGKPRGSGKSRSAPSRGAGRRKASRKQRGKRNLRRRKA